MTALSFQGSHVAGEVQPLGAMLGPCAFALPDGRRVDPFALAPWADEDGPALPGILRRLRGEWPCVPFGMPVPRRDLPPDWMAGLPPGDDAGDPHPHGFGANHDWLLVPDGDGVRADIGYPAAHPIRALTRTVHPDPSAAALDLTLTVHPRRDVALPVGLHPTFRMPEAEGSVRLIAPGARAWSFPVPAEPGRSRAAPDARGVSLDAMPAADGGMRSLLALPWPAPGEDLILLTGVGGRVRLEFGVERYAVTLTWDPAVLPACLLWLSDRGRDFHPWNGRFRGLGVEPVAAPFDLGALHATRAAGPLTRAGVPVSVPFRAGVPWGTRYRIAVDPLPAQAAR